MVIERLIELYREAMRADAYGRDPEFLVVPWQVIPSLDAEMRATMKANPSTVGLEPGRFRDQMVRGEVQFRGIPVYPGHRYGWGVHSEGET